MPTPTYLQCTKAVLQGFGLQPAALQAAPAAVSRLGNWTLNRVQILDRTAFLFMSDRTYLNFPILEGKSKVELEDMPSFLQHGLYQLLSGMSVASEAIEAAISDLQEVAITKATNRSSLAMHAAIADDYAHVLRDFKRLDDTRISHAISRVNNLPRKKLQWATSVESTLELLSASAA